MGPGSVKLHALGLVARPTPGTDGFRKVVAAGPPGAAGAGMGCGALGEGGGADWKVNLIFTWTYTLCMDHRHQTYRRSSVNHPATKLDQLCYMPRHEADKREGPRFHSLSLSPAVAASAVLSAAAAVPAGAPPAPRG